MKNNHDTSAGRFFAVLIVSILLTETMVMFLLAYINLDPFIEILIDLFLLFLIVLPALYFFSFRPLNSHIKEIEQLQKDLAVNEEKYRLLAENLPLNIFLKDKNSVYLYCNKNYATDLKISSTDIIGKTDYDFFDKELAEEYRNYDRQVIATGETKDVEEKYTAKGKELWVRTVRTPYKNNAGEITGILGVFWDVTERKIATEKLKEHAEELELLNKATIGRELKLIELKKEIEELKKKLKT